MKKSDNLNDIESLKRYQNKWIAFDSAWNILASSKSFIKLSVLISKLKLKDIQTTFLTDSSARISP